jgi:hypothetical protein
MCDPVNLSYLERHFPVLREARRVLEEGSFNVNGNRKPFAISRGLDRLGIDIRGGTAVDLVCDVTGKRDAVMRSLPAPPTTSCFA